jgi:tyrosyl-tRNA synthetase
VIFLIGSYTAMIGDPTGRDQMRQPLTKEQVEENFHNYKEQASKILDFSKVQIRYNDEWLEKLQGQEILKLMSSFTVQQMLQRDMFKERLKKGEDLSPTEFMYPLLQAYDSVVLDVDCEIGGNDQLFNMLCGRKLQKAYGKRDKFVLTTKLLEGTDGRKMSKTYDNCIYITDDANSMFGKVMSVKDDLMTAYFECCTDVPMDEVMKIVKGNPRDAKVRLATEIVSLYHGEKAAMGAKEEFDRVFSKKEAPEDMEEMKMKKEESLVDLLVRAKVVTSKSEARRLIEQKAVSIDGNTITAIDAPATPGVAKVGKRKFVKIL